MLAYASTLPSIIYRTRDDKDQSPTPRLPPSLINKRHRSSRTKFSETDMTGRPGCRTMEMIGGSSASYLVCTPCVPLFVHCLIRVEAEGLLDFQGRAGIVSIVRWNLRPVIFGVEISIQNDWVESWGFPSLLSGDIKLVGLGPIPIIGKIEWGVFRRGFLQ